MFSVQANYLHIFLNFNRKLQLTNLIFVLFLTNYIELKLNIR